MKRRFIYILSFLAAAFAFMTSCQQEIFPSVPDVPDGYVRISFNVDAPQFTEVETRAVDPDGGYVNNIVLFCFDVYGIFISTVEAVNNLDDSGLSGTFTATIPESTVCIHFVANQNHDALLRMNFTNKTEGEALESLEASSGRMIYWGHIDLGVAPEGKTTQEHLNDVINEQTSIKLIRNHAEIAVNPDTENTDLKVIGMSVNNAHAFGTVCPWHPYFRFDFNWEYFDDAAKRAADTELTEEERGYYEEGFVTIPVNKTKLSAVDRTTSDFSRYVYEHENTLDDPISVIIAGQPSGVAGSDTLYYRVMLLDENGEPMMVRRNHRYIINIVGDLDYGQKTYAEAVNSPATNNIWISVADNIKEIRNSKYSLSVEETSFILDQKNTISPNNGFEFTYTLTNLSGANITAEDEPEIDWVDGNEVGHPTIISDFNPKGGSSYTGTVEITLNDMGTANSLEGTVLIKVGSLFRRVKIITIKTQSFNPAWVSAEVYAGQNPDEVVEDKAHATIMFTIPEDTPDELFPFNVLISCNKLGVRFIEGNDNFEDYTMPIVRESDPDYGNTHFVDKDGTEIELYGYKYAFEVKDSGVHRLYMENVLYEGDGATAQIYIEAPHFEMINKQITFSDVNQAIYPVMHSYVGMTSTGQPFDENVYYILVPQKKHAEVKFGMKLASSSSSSSSSSVAINAYDEFLIYSKNLVLANHENYYKDEETELGCEYFQVPSLIWNESSNGRMMALRPLSTFDDAPTEENPDGIAREKYNLVFRTEKAKSDEVIRITSIPDPNSDHPDGYSSFSGMAVFDEMHSHANLNLLTALHGASVRPSDWSGYNPYEGENYRSTTFELSNYNPFRFAAVVTYAPDEDPLQNNNGVLSGLKVSYGENDIPGDHTSEERVTNMDWPYRPGTKVDVQFDLTTFVGSDYVHVDPFGESFEIYIDAPMLEIDDSRLSLCNLNSTKLRAELGPDNKPTGRFIYTVEKTQAEEAKFGTDPALRKEFDPILPVPGIAKPDSFKLRTGNDDNGIPVTQGERKTLPFRVKSIVNEGQIRIYSDKEMVVFYDKVFNVTNSPRNLKLTYGADNELIPPDAFVSFELERNHNRIGVITMKQTVEKDRNCSLRLRGEYDYEWLTDPVVFRYQDGTGAVYTYKVESLDKLFDDPVFNLTVQETTAANR